MGKVVDFIMELTDPSAPGGKLLRKKFFHCPEGLLDFRGIPAEAKAVIFAMQRPLLIEWLRANETATDWQKVEDAIMKFDFGWDEVQNATQSVWDPGNIYDTWQNADDGCALYPPDSVAAPPPEAAAAKAAGGGGGWTGPFPAIWRVDPYVGSIANGHVDVEIVAEGMLKGAKLLLSQPWEGGSGYIATDITWRKSSNFRRTYATAHIVLANEPEGEYEVSLLNSLGAPLVWWEEGLFIVTP
jgi:hypothetical protein